MDLGGCSVSRVRTMEEFAALSGISRPTLSKYFNDPDSVRSTTRARIEAALAQHDYRPNLFAMNQNRRVTRIIGILVPHIVDPFFAEIIRQLESRCATQGYWAIVLSSHGAPERETRAIETLRSLKPAGVVLAPLGLSSEIARIEGLMAEVPCVFMDTTIGPGLPFVGNDNAQSIGLMVDYLCRTGARPCYLDMPPVNGNATERRQAYEAAMTRLGQVPVVVPSEGEGWDFEELGYRAARRLLAGPGFPTGTVLCGNDRTAIGVLAAAGEMGLRVGLGPEADLRVAGHDNHPQARYTCPPLTTVAQDFDAIAGQSLDLLFQMIETREDALAEAAAGNDDIVLPPPTAQAAPRRLEARLILRGSA